MKNSKPLLVIGVVVSLLFILLIFFLTKKPTHEPSGPTQIPSSGLDVVAQYIQFRENAVGADQSSSTSWLQSTRPIITPRLYNQLQPNQNTSTSAVSAEYKIAHSNGFTVKASVYNCTTAQPIETKGTIRCEVTNKTLKNGSEVAASDLPFGWTRNGQQLAISIRVVNLNGKWLVDEDIISQSD